LLSPKARHGLAAAMFTDVARALGEVRHADRIFVVTNYEPVGQQAKSLGFDMLLEQSQHSESASEDWASRELEARGYDLVLRLPADIPMVTAEDIDLLLDMSTGQPGALMVPSRDGTGTNSIMRTPPTLFPSHFGPDSLRLHSEEAHMMGVSPLIVVNEHIGLDIDEPGDLVMLVESGRSTETFGFLMESGVAEAVISSRGKCR